MIAYNVQVCDIEKTETIEFHIKKRMMKLSVLCDQISNCSIVLSMENKNAHSGKVYLARISVNHIANKVINVKKSDENIYVAIYNAFDALERLINKYTHQRENQYKYNKKKSVLFVENQV